LLGRCDGKIQLKDLGLKYNINMHLQEAGWGGMDWFAVAPDRDRWRALVNAVLNLRSL